MAKKFERVFIYYAIEITPTAPSLQSPAQEQTKQTMTTNQEVGSSNLPGSAIVETFQNSHLATSKQLQENLVSVLHSSSVDK